MENELLKRAKCYDLQALGEIYDQYSTGLYSYSACLLGSSAEAEECVSETFSRFLRALKNGGGPKDNLRAYLFRIAHNWITDQYRQHAPITVPLDEDVRNSEEALTDYSVQEKLWVEQFRAALRCLTHDQRQVIQLKYVEGWENEEIAAAIAKPVGAVKSLQHRALRSLRRVLSEEGD